jgi:hypothetical protein
MFHVMAAAGAAEKSGRQLVFFLPRLYDQHHGHFTALFRMFPQISILESFPEWTEHSEDANQKFSPFEVSSESSPLVVLKGNLQNCDNFPSNPSFYPALPSPLPPPRPSWAIHFRFGDFKILSHHRHPLGPYYAQLLKSKVPNQTTPLTLFSDEPERLEQIAKEFESLGYSNVTIIRESDPIETFKIFSSCQGGAICSNSTFAWWGAFFAWQREKSFNYKAYFPSRFMPNERPYNLFTFPFTQAVEVEALPAEPSIKSFSYE